MRRRSTYDPLDRPSSSLTPPMCVSHQAGSKEKEVEEEEYDPLDAFMADINAEVRITRRGDDTEMEGGRSGRVEVWKRQLWVRWSRLVGPGPERVTWLQSCQGGSRSYGPTIDLMNRQHRHLVLF